MLNSALLDLCEFGVIFVEDFYLARQVQWNYPKATVMNLTESGQWRIVVEELN